MKNYLQKISSDSFKNELDKLSSEISEPLMLGLETAGLGYTLGNLKSANKLVTQMKVPYRSYRKVSINRLKEKIGNRLAKPIGTAMALAIKHPIKATGIMAGASLGLPAVLGLLKKGPSAEEVESFNTIMPGNPMYRLARRLKSRYNQ